MKTNILTLLAGLLITASCGTASQYASSQKFQDGFYKPHSDKETRLAAETASSEMARLVSQTEKSNIFRSSAHADTLAIRQTAAPQTAGTVSLYPDGYSAGYTAGYTAGLNAYAWPYSPWRPWSSWYWDASSWYWSGIYWDSWYSTWYSPWYGCAWYWDDPWYGCGPWYHHYGHAGWFDPAPSYYRGRDTYWGARTYTESNRGTLTRTEGGRRGSDGMGVSSAAVRRNPVRTGGSSAATARPSAGSGSSYRPSAGSVSSSAVRRSASSSYSRPASSASRSGQSYGTGSAYRSSGASSEYRTSSGSSSSYRSSSSSESSYRTQPSGSYSTGAVRSSSYSGGGFSGGGAARSSGSTGGSSVRRR